ncbi:MAG: hypothetical protein ABGZ17_07270 [Planctomycetaceae bacterium]
MDVFDDHNTLAQGADRFRITFRATVLAMVCFSWNNAAIAFQDDSRLQRRIVELESENRALRKIITDIQRSLELVPKVPKSGQDNVNTLRIVVFPDNWGGSELEDIRRVCASSAAMIWSEMPDDDLLPILVRRSQSGPITLFRRGKGSEYIVKLDTGSNAWAQCAFQFSHEFCHIVCNYRDAPNRQLWFEETLSECASLYALRRMAVEWKTNAPYSNWKSYASALQDYAANRIKKYDGRTTPVPEFYRMHKVELEKNATNRELNGYMAVKLLSLFEKTPEAWHALRYINLGPPEENASLQTYLAGWRGRVPSRHRPFVEKVGREFGIDLAQD